MIERRNLWAITRHRSVRRRSRTTPSDRRFDDRLEIGGWEDRADDDLDGRASASVQMHHPARQLHGVWEGSTLVATTTHMKALISRNGTPTSDDDDSGYPPWRRNDRACRGRGSTYLTEPVMARASSSTRHQMHWSTVRRRYEAWTTGSARISCLGRIRPSR
jgi:hypothetical protein